MSVHLSWVKNILYLTKAWKLRQPLFRSPEAVKRSLKKSVLKNSVKFSGKHLCQDLLF